MPEVLEREAVTYTQQREQFLQKQKGKYVLIHEDKVLGFFVGQIMKEMKGKANPQIVNDLLKSKLESYRK